MEPTTEDNGSSLPLPRLMITKMVLENFKSYAGIREIGPFHKCFSSIVGPNGSGKSNVIDAMLFVFGKRAKKLRLNKVSELIHKSSAVKDAQSAQVSVYFQDIIDTGTGDEDYIVVPATETVVTRTARKDNSSTYKLNGKACSFKDVAEYLGSKGIDLDNNRFLILQGEVEMISMMAPKGKTEHDEGLLEYLEDIIGSNAYVADTNLAAEKVDALTEQRQEKLNRVKAVEQEKDSLEGAKLEAEALLQKEREIRRKQNILYQLYESKHKQQASHIVVSKHAVDQKLKEVREKLADAASRVHEIDAGVADQRMEYEQIHSSLQRTKEEFAAYERRDIKLREDLKLCKAQTKKLDAKIKQESKREEDAVKAIMGAQESIPTLEATIKKLHDKKTIEDGKLEAIFDAMKDATDQMRSHLEMKTNELAPLQQERAVFQASLETAQMEASLLTDSVQRNQEQLSSSEKELASLDECQSRKRQELSLAEDELVASKNQIEDLEKEDKELERVEVTLIARHKSLLAMEEESKAALHAKGGGSEAVKGILRAARHGGELANVGILGRLGDLATVDEKYDVAVSTACSMLDHIVVQTTAGAQRCLAFLRQHGLGRANFIPLDKMKKGAHDRVVETPEDAARLFELIHPANFSVTPALYLGVGNTLVAPDLETATRWAYEFDKRWRVVTVDGHLIETSGTMAGGGKTVRRGGMRIKNAARVVASLTENENVSDLKALAEKASKTAEELKQCRQRRRNIAQEIHLLTKRIKALSVRLPKLSIEIEGFDTTRSTLTERIPELRSQCELSEHDRATLKKLNQEVEKRKTEMASCAMQASKLESDVARIQKSILEAGGPKLKKQQAVCNIVLKELDESGKKLNTALVAIAACEKAVAKAKAAKVENEEELETLKVTTQEKLAEFRTLEEGALEVMQQYEEVKVLEAEKHRALEEVFKEIEVLKKSQSVLKGTEIELMGQVEALEKQINDLDRKCLHWASEIEKLHAAEEGEDEYDASDDEAEDDEKTSEEAADHEMAEDADTNGVTCGERAGVAANQRASCLARLSLKSLEQYREEDVKAQISVLETEKVSLAKNANMGAIAEYRRKEADYLSRVSELDAVTEERNKARNAHEELRRMRLEKFMDGFGQITLKLKEMYQMITLGGDAELELVDSLDPFSEGIVFSVRPPKKSWKNIANLSGGEKTLSSLALVFALHHYKPTPLYVMDEIDAALDFKNVSIVANYIKERTKNAQFIIISLRNNMFELADRLVGVYKTNNCTKSITIDPRAFGVSSGQPVPLIDRTNVGRLAASEKSVRDNHAEQSSIFVD